MLAGVLVGLVGFLPMFLLVRAVFKGWLEPKIGTGLAFVLFSLILLAACTAVLWVRSPRLLVPFIVGVLAGFFLFMGLTAGWTRRQDSGR